jgi:mannose-6-phosphate isomerase-like protein (cupin superfamily)
MTTTHEIQPGRRIDLARLVVGIDGSDRRARFVEQLLYLISGAVTVTLELADGDRLVDLGAGDAVVVPRGVWHKITHTRIPRTTCSSCSRAQ